MNQNDMRTARGILDGGDFTCVLCRGDHTYTARERGVKPLVSWLDSGMNFSGCCAADRVVGRGAAFLYCLLQVDAVYARVMSTPAAQVLSAHGIAWECDQEVGGIINRRGDGPCPFENAVMDITDPQEALAAIRDKMVQLGMGR